MCCCVRRFIILLVAVHSSSMFLSSGRLLLSRASLPSSARLTAFTPYSLTRPRFFHSSSALAMSSASTAAPSASASEGPFYNIVIPHCKSNDARNQLMSYWGGFAQCQKPDFKNKIVFSYECFHPHPTLVPEQTDKDKDMLTWETYASKEVFDNVWEKTDVTLGFLHKLKTEPLFNPAGPNITCWNVKYCGVGFHSKGAAREEKSRPAAGGNCNNVVLAVIFKFKSEDALKNQFLPLWKNLVDATYAEEGALTYEGFLFPDDPSKFLIFERYDSEDALKETHWKSEAFLSFQKTLTEMNIVESKSRKAYKELNVGIWGDK